MSTRTNKPTPARRPVYVPPPVLERVPLWRDVLTLLLGVAAVSGGVIIAMLLSWLASAP